MYIVEMYVIIVTCISPRNLAVYIRPANLVEKIAPGGLTKSRSYASVLNLLKDRVFMKVLEMIF